MGKRKNVLVQHSLLHLATPLVCRQIFFFAVFFFFFFFLSIFFFSCFFLLYYFSGVIIFIFFFFFHSQNYNCRSQASRVLLLCYCLCSGASVLPLHQVNKFFFFFLISFFFFFIKISARTHFSNIHHNTIKKEFHSSVG